MTIEQLQTQFYKALVAKANLEVNNHNIWSIYQVDDICFDDSDRVVMFTMKGGKRWYATCDITHQLKFNHILASFEVVDSNEDDGFTFRVHLDKPLLLLHRQLVCGQVDAAIALYDSQE